MAIDLHIHSINSDGTDTVDEIVEKALEMELEAISITDHEYLTIPKKNFAGAYNNLLNKLKFLCPNL